MYNTLFTYTTKTNLLIIDIVFIVFLRPVENLFSMFVCCVGSDKRRSSLFTSKHLYTFGSKFIQLKPD